MSKFLKALVTTAGDRRAVITQRLDGLIHVGFERWDDTAVASTGGYNDPFWRPDGEGVLLHTVEEAEALVVERIGAVTGEG